MNIKNNKLNNMENNKQVVTRFAPSPTGSLHIGGSRTALFNYLYARKHNGRFILRIEDTDKARSSTAFESEIIKAMEWLSLKYDEMYRQSEREEIYKKYIEILLKNDNAYISKEDTGGDENKRSEVIRFKNPNEKVTFDDLIRGEVTFDTSDLGDFIIARSIDEPLYHLTVVVDDKEMGVTHVIRAEEHISNTPRQLLIIRALGFEEPKYAHIPLILAPDKSKLSKRHGAVSTLDYRDKGYLPDAVINYLALLGWNPGTEQEIFSKQELIEFFSISQVQKGGAIFSEEKLSWINKAHLKNLSKIELRDQIQKRINANYKALGKTTEIDESQAEMVRDLFSERISVFCDIDEWQKNGELDFIFNDPNISKEEIVWKDSTIESTILHLNFIEEKLNNLSESEFKYERIKSAIWEYADEKGRGEVLWPFRFALSGQKKSPDPFSLAEVFGRDTTLKRVKNAVILLTK